MTMLRFAPQLRRSLSLVLLAGAFLPARAQPDCDSLHTASFTRQSLGGYLYQFTPGVPDPFSTVMSPEWGFLGEGFTQFSLSPQPQVQFPGMDDYMVCLQAVVLDSEQTGCNSLHCELVPIPVDSACAGVLPAFTITPQGNALQFTDQTVSNLPITGYSWDFGDGATSSEAAPTHQYAGNGPYQACLSVTAGPCMRTVCNWIYTGPYNVPCDTLLHAAIGVIQYQQAVAVFDQSITSGMNSAVHWDFGDGATATGSPAIHLYSTEDYFNVCGTVALWGPLASDTCISTACQEIYTGTNAAGVHEMDRGPGLHAWPVPFTNACTVEGISGPCSWALVDVPGRVRQAGTMQQAGLLTIQGNGLAAGPYLLRVISARGVEVVRMVKAVGR